MRCIDLEEVERYLSNLKGNKIIIATPQRGDKVRFLEMAKKNAVEAMRLRYKKNDESKEKLEAIKQLANYIELEDVPNRIEAYDISHTSGTEVVASMVVFKNGVASKKDYRKFKMKQSTKNDDYAAMKEVLGRRFKYMTGEKTDSKFSEKPSLIFVDGGLGQVNAATQTAREEGVENIPIFGIYKDDKHKTKGVLGIKKQYEIPVGTKCFSLITEIQDEMHRVAISYHRYLRSKKNTESQIMKIPGVGKARFRLLMDRFKTIGTLKKATIDEISEIKGISAEHAKEIYEYLKKV